MCRPQRGYELQRLASADRSALRRQAFRCLLKCSLFRPFSTISLIRNIEIAERRRTPGLAFEFRIERLAGRGSTSLSSWRGSFHPYVSGAASRRRRATRTALVGQRIVHSQVLFPVCERGDLRARIPCQARARAQQRTPANRRGKNQGKPENRGRFPRRPSASTPCAEIACHIPLCAGCALY